MHHRNVIIMKDKFGTISSTYDISFGIESHEKSELEIWLLQQPLMWLQKNLNKDQRKVMWVLNGYGPLTIIAKI